MKYNRLQQQRKIPAVWAQSQARPSECAVEAERGQGAGGWNEGGNIGGCLRIHLV